MLKDPPTIRILPMSSTLPGFRDRTIEDVQQNLFLKELPKGKGLFHYRTTGLNAPRHSLLLFQFRARIIASAELLYDEKYDKPRKHFGGALHLDIPTLRTFDPLDVDMMKKAWPSFRAFGHAKQRLNPAAYPDFKKLLKHINKPATTKK